MNKFIPVSEPNITNKEKKYVLRAINSGWISSIGNFITEFEEYFAKYVGTKFALTTSNGTTALHLALVSLGIKRGDEVIIPDLTFIATANAVAYTGAKPIMVDIEPDTWCINPESIKRAITKKTKAIIPVHLYGHPANMEIISQIAKEYDLILIEDAAEAHGAEFKGKKVGSIGNCGVFSFYGNKIITTGEGGMITTNDENLYERAKFLRDHAMTQQKRYWHTDIGFNYRMTNIQAAIGLAQIERIDELISKKRKIYHWYKKFLGDLEQITINPEKDWAKNVFWMVSIVLDRKVPVSRDEVMVSLRQKGIDSRPFFYPISEMPMYRINKIEDNPIAKTISKRGINLPSSVNLKKKDVLWIVENLKTILKFI